MKPPALLKNLPTPARMLFRPMLLISLALHGVVLMLPIPPDPEKPELSKKEEQVKITQLPTTRPSPKPSVQSSSEPSPLLSPQLDQSTPREEPTLPEPTTTRQQSAEFPLPLRIRKLISRSQQPSKQSQQQPKKEEARQRLTEEPTRSQSTEEQKRAPSTEEQKRSQSTQKSAQSQSPQEPTPSPPAQEPTPSPPAQEPTPSPPAQESTVNNEATGGDDYSKLGQQVLSDNSFLFKVALEQVEHYKNLQENLKGFDNEVDINKLTEATAFKDTNGKPDDRFKFLKKAVSPLTTQDMISSLEKEFTRQGFGFNKIDDYGGGPLYEVTKGDFKRYLIFAPGKDEQGNPMTAIILSENKPS
jgi:DNA polymerase III gamma/tau subunit